MTGLQEAEKLLAGMLPGEKAQLLQWLVRDIGNAFPGIESHPDVCGGVPCVIRTRIPVWVAGSGKVVRCHRRRPVTLLSDSARGGSGQCPGLLRGASG